MSAKRSLNGRITLMLFVATLAFVMFAPSTQASFTVDSSFGSRGLVSGITGPINLSAVMSPKALAIDSSGRTIVGAASGSKWTIWRVLRSGELDPSFGDQGRTEVSTWGSTLNPAPVNLAAGAIRPDGRILLVGYRAGALRGDKRLETAYMLMKQLMPNGKPDPAFGVNGGKSAGAKRGATSVAFRPDGGFLVAGFKQYSPTGPTDDAALFSFSPTGQIEQSFGQGENVDGVNIFGALRKPSIFFDVDVLDNGRILAAGMIRGRLLVVKLRANGFYDRSFGHGGKVVYLPDREARWATAREIEVDRKGRVLVVGYASPKNPTSSAGYGLVIRLRKDGRFDRSFAAKGTARLYATARLGNRSTRLYSVAVDQDGGIWTTGSAGRVPRGTRHAILLRYLPDGQKDPKFFNRGLRKIRPGEASVGTSIIRADRKMVASGRYDLDDEERFFVSRFVTSPQKG